MYMYVAVIDQKCGALLEVNQSIKHPIAARGLAIAAAILSPMVRMGYRSSRLWSAYLSD